MNVLVVGGGGREHAIIMKLAESQKINKLYCTPGNGGIKKYAQCFSVNATDIDGVVKLAKELSVDMVVVAPDDPLVLGMVDALEAEGIKAFGPNKAAAFPLYESEQSNNIPFTILGWVNISYTSLSDLLQSINSSQLLE